MSAVRLHAALLENVGPDPDGTWVVVTARGERVGRMARDYRRAAVRWEGAPGTGLHRSKRAALASWQEWADAMAARLAP